MKIPTKTKCPECERVFDLLNEVDAEEWHYGHDCEDLPRDTPAAVLARHGVAIVQDANGTRVKK